MTNNWKEIYHCLLPLRVNSSLVSELELSNNPSSALTLLNLITELAGKLPDDLPDDLLAKPKEHLIWELYQQSLINASPDNSEDSFTFTKYHQITLLIKDCNGWWIEISLNDFRFVNFAQWQALFKLNQQKLNFIPKSGELYLHYKRGTKYIILGSTLDPEELVFRVEYVGIKDKIKYSRTLENFTAKIGDINRFMFIERHSIFQIKSLLGEADTAW